MTDPDIISLYFQRSEQAVAESKLAYGGYLRAVAGRILQDPRDAEEAEADAYFKAWGSIPPEKPQSLKAYLGALCRNAALDLLRKNRRQKRGGGTETAFCEIEDMLCSRDVAEETAEGIAFSQAVNAFLGALPKAKRRIFVQRYWYFMTPQEIASDNYMTRQAVNTCLMRLRRSFAEHLEREGFLS